jgi:hypothetical protein
MPRIFFFIVLSFLSLWSACKQMGPWEKFTACAQNHCVAEALALMDAYLADSRAVLEKIHASAENGEDTGLGWTYIIRDSVLLNPSYGDTEARLGLQKALTNTALPFAVDPKLGVIAKNLVDIWGSSAITEKQASQNRNLEGTWVSEKDPRYEIQIDLSMFKEYYDGQEQSNAPYAFFAKCPEACNPLAPELPCLRVDALDVLCYTVVASSEDILQLSLIGGNGSTLPFSRKK